MTPKQSLIASLTGTIVVALCCFTPILVVILTAIGLGAIISYLDHILLPALAILLILTIASYRRYRKTLNRRNINE